MDHSPTTLSVTAVNFTRVPPNDLALGEREKISHFLQLFCPLEIISDVLNINTVSFVSYFA